MRTFQSLASYCIFLLLHQGLSCRLTSARQLNSSLSPSLLYASNAWCQARTIHSFATVLTDCGPFSSFHSFFTVSSMYLHEVAFLTSCFACLSSENLGHFVRTVPRFLPCGIRGSLLYLKQPCPVMAWPRKKFTSPAGLVVTVGNSFLDHGTLCIQFLSPFNQQLVELLFEFLQLKASGGCSKLIALSFALDNGPPFL